MYENEIPIGRAKDLRNQKFGRWTPLYRVKGKNTKTYWHCKCDCGNEKDVDAQSLLRGISNSCGCLHNELLAKNNKNKIIDMEGLQFGKLIVLERISGSNHGSIWKCKCSCGNTINASGFEIRRGNITSCGCSRSKGEEKIIKLLCQNNIPFEKEKTFDSCILPSGRKARFDFYVDNKYLIEFDGIQHYQPTKGWNTEEQYQKTVIYDAYKNQWCKENNIPLIRIPYTKLDSLTINDLIF